MDRKSIIILVLCFVMLMLWSTVIVPKLYPPKPLPPGATNSVSATQPPEASNAPVRPAAITLPSSPTAITITNASEPEQVLTCTNSDAIYTFTSYGGGIKQIELIHYPETVPSWLEKQEKSGGVATLNAQAPAPVLALLAGSALEGESAYQLTRTATGVRAEAQLTNGLSIVKEFNLSSNYLMTGSVRLENRSTNTLTLPSQGWMVGTATPMNAQDNNMAEGLMWYNGDKAVDIVGASYFSSRSFGCVPRVPPTEYRGGGSNVVWAAVHNQFFALALMPQDPAVDIVARRVDLPRATGDDARLASEGVPPPQGYETWLVYPGLNLAPNQSLQRPFMIFAGPKEYRTLASIAARLNNRIDSIMGFGTIWGFFSKALLLAMNALHDTTRLAYGWTIVAITVLIKAVFWPLTAASTRSMKKMQALQPQLKVIQEKYKDDPMKAQKKTMELWKENKVNPMGGCLPMLIQMPIFIGFFTMIRTAIELRGASFLWIKDLSQPDTIFMLPGLGFVPVIGKPGVGLPFNLLPLIMGGTMLWQSHLTPPSPGMDPAQQKIMRYMPLIFLVFLYNYSAGMALYWTTNNLLTILQTKLTRTRDAAVAVAPPLTPAPKKRK